MATGPTSTEAGGAVGAVVAQIDLAHRPKSALLLNMQRVFARLVAEVGDESSIRRPRWIALSMIVKKLVMSWTKLASDMLRSLHAEIIAHIGPGIAAEWRS